MKNDKYSHTRGGWSRILDISCEACGNHTCFYQKDGPGNLRRLYVDRIIGTTPIGRVFTCEACGRELGVRIIWKKENRPAYRLFQDAVKKKIVNQTLIKEKFI